MAVVLPVILLLVLVIINILLLRASPAVYQLYEIYMNPESKRYRSKNDRNPYIPVCTSQEAADAADEVAEGEGEDTEDEDREVDNENKMNENKDEDNDEGAVDKQGDGRSKHSVLKLPRIGYPPPSALSKEALMPGRINPSLLKKSEAVNRLGVTVDP
jgi:hypothetical protein